MSYAHYEVNTMFGILADGWIGGEIVVDWTGMVTEVPGSGVVQIS